jgi:hypothetical protein
VKTPITAGGFVKDGRVIFRHIAETPASREAAHYGHRAKNYILETTGSGAPLLDYHNDECGS